MLHMEEILFNYIEGLIFKNIQLKYNYNNNEKMIKKLDKKIHKDLEDCSN